MPRPPKWRRISFLPSYTYFKPAGVPLKQMEEVQIGVEELEAIRLKDLEGLDQEDCAHKMGISRATFHRIINAAREKITRALVEGKAIRLDNGEDLLGKTNCSHCGVELDFSHNETIQNLEFCPRSLKIKCPSCGKSIVTTPPKSST